VTTEINDTATPQDGANVALDHVRNIITSGGLNAEAAITRVEGDLVCIDITGDDAGYFVGRRGQVLDSLQYLLLVMVTHNKPGTGRLRIQLDADGYRKRREESLKELAQSLADQVKATGEEAVLEPLNALERRIVHTELADDPDVETYSEGEDSNRHIVITPRRK
jgi:spoIIIJ-associated protein